MVSGTECLMASVSLSFVSPPTDDLVEVEKLVVQVKERTSNVQALTHGTVGQYLPVGCIDRSDGPWSLMFHRHI